MSGPAQILPTEQQIRDAATEDGTEPYLAQAALGWRARCLRGEADAAQRILALEVQLAAVTPVVSGPRPSAAARTDELVLLAAEEIRTEASTLARRLEILTYGLEELFRGLRARSAAATDPATIDRELGEIVS